MIPTFRSSLRHQQRKRLLVMTLLFVGLCGFVNIYHLGYYYPSPSNEESSSRQIRGEQEKHVLPLELVEFVQRGGFDDSEKVAVESNAPVEQQARTPTTQQSVEASLSDSSIVTLLEEQYSTQNPEKHHRMKQRYHRKERDTHPLVKAATTVQRVKASLPASTIVTPLNEHESNHIQEKHHRMKLRYHRKDHDDEPVAIVQPKQHHRQKQRYHKPKVAKHDGFPPLDRLVNQDKITGSVDWLLDFAILGHAKCATTYLMNWLRQHETVQMHDREVCDLNNRQPASLVRKLYTELEPGEDYLRGFKCPGHFSREPLRYFRQYFENTKLIVGLRHPVRWFER